MAAKPWVSVEAARKTAGAKYERHFASWATGGVGAVVVDIPLHPPSEAAALVDPDAAITWVRSWRDADQNGAVKWASRRWASLGTQSVPERLRLEGAEAVARFSGKAAHWKRVAHRAAFLLEELGREESVTEAVRRSSAALAELAEADFDRLLQVMKWLIVNPESGLYIRQLPVRGVDTKWVTRHRHLVQRLFTAASGNDALGLSEPPPQVRIRFLDEALRPGGLTDIAAPVSELADLQVCPSTVFVFENLESVVAMPPMAGAVVLHGAGYAVEMMGRIPWVRDGRVVYWGDLDSHGFGILNRIRSACTNVTTVLMDSPTLNSFTDLWVPEPKPNTGALSHLLPEELLVLAELQRHGNVRLEQERIEWGYALKHLTAAAASAL